MRRMAAEGTGIVFVSHRLEEVFAISGRMTVLKNGEYVATVETADTSRPPSSFSTWSAGRWR